MDLKIFLSIFFIIIGILECAVYVENRETFELLKRNRPAKAQNVTLKAKTTTSTKKIQVTFRKKKQNLATKKIVTIKPK